MSDIIDIFERAAHAAGEVAIKMQPGVAIHTHKGAGDFSTQGDIDAGRAIRDILIREMPGVPLLHEEQPEDEQVKVLKSSTFVLFDYLDATIAYYNQCPDWGHTLGFVQDGRLTHSVMYLPTSDTMVTAEEGLGCHLNGKRIHLRQDTSLNETILGITFNRTIPRSFHDQVSTELCYLANGTRCLNSNIGGITEVVQGRCGGFINLVGHSWDFVGALAVQEAGGVAVSANDHHLQWDRIQMSLLAAANVRIAKEMLNVSSQWREYNQHHWK